MTGVLAPGAHAEGIPVGKWLFSPWLDVVWQSEDNLFLENQEPDSASSYALRPHLAWELPFRQSSFRVDYSPEIRGFIGRSDDGGLQDRYYSHFLDVDTRLTFSNMLKVRVRDRFIVNTFETLNFDPGGEVPFNSVEYRRNRADVEAIKQIGPRQGAGVAIWQESLDFDESGDASFLSYELLGAELLYMRELTPTSRLTMGYGFGSADQERQPTAGQDGLETFETRDVRVSWQSTVGRTSLAEVRLDYLSWDFEDPDEEDFDGFSGELRYRMQLDERSRLESTLSRYPLQSFFNVNNYYVTSSIDLRLRLERGQRLYYTLGGAYRINDYPERVVLPGSPFDGELREDRLWRGEVGVGCKFMDTFTAELRFRRDSRDSNLDGLDYTANRFVVQVTYGWF